MSHKSHTNSTQLPGLPSTPPASRPICYHLHRQILLFRPLWYILPQPLQSSLLGIPNMQCSSASQGSCGWPNTSSHRPDRTTCSLAALHLLFTCCSSRSESLSSFKAQLNCVPPVYLLPFTTRLSLPLLHSSSILQPYTLQSCVSPPHPLVVTRTPAIHPQGLSFPGSLVSPLLLRCCQQVNPNTERVHIPLLLPSPRCSSSSSQGSYRSFCRCEACLGILCESTRIKRINDTNSNRSLLPTRVLGKRQASSRKSRRQDGEMEQVCGTT